MPGYQIFLWTEKPRQVLVLPLSVHTEAFPAPKHASKVGSNQLTGLRIYNTEVVQGPATTVLVGGIETMFKINKNDDSSK